MSAALVGELGACGIDLTKQLVAKQPVRAGVNWMADVGTTPPAALLEHQSGERTLAQATVAARGGRCHDAGMDAKRLQGVALFSGLSKSELDALAGWTDEISVDAGYELAREGHFAHEFFVIEDGAAAVVQGERRIAELGPGDFFGELGLLETERRTASVVATTPMELIVMFQREFRQMEQAFPAVADRVRSAIRARLDADADDSGG